MSENGQEMVQRDEDTNIEDIAIIPARATPEKLI